MKGRLVTTAVLAGLFLLPGASIADTFRVKAVDGDAFRPRTRTISRGDKIVWKNTDDTSHTVTSRGSNWSKNTILSPGETTSRKFRRRGTYRYICNFHSDMTGKIVVE